MSENTFNYYVLLVEEQGQIRAIRLDAEMYTVGRDASNTIVLDDAKISRTHALLIRNPIHETTRYCYDLLDGSLAGSPSRNGTFVNGKQYIRRTLKHGDMLRFGDTLQAYYVQMDSPYEYLPNIRSFNDVSSLIENRLALPNSEN